MAGRPTLQHPDIATLQAELAMLESQKSAKEQEMLGVASDIKRLKQEREDEKKKIDEEVAHTRLEAEAEIVLIDKALESAHARKADVEREIQELARMVREIDSTKKEEGEEHARLEALRKKRKDEEFEFNSLHLLKRDVEEELLINREGLEIIAKQHAQLTEELSTLRASHTEETQKYVAARDRVEVLEKEIKHLEASAKEKNAELNSVLGNINERNGVLLELANKVTQSEKEQADREAAIQERDADSAKRAGNAAKLELHVDNKLQHLKELESHFTIERLARHGYKKTE